MDIAITFEGLDNVKRHLTQDLYEKPWAAGMQRLGAAGLAFARAGAPVKTGELKASIRYRVQKRALPLWVAVDVTAKHARGGLTKRGRVSRAKYSYPRRLEFDPRSKHKGWLLGQAKRALAGKANDVLQQVAREIESIWKRVF